MPHNTLLHRNESNPRTQTHFGGTSREVLLRVIPVELTGPNDTIKLDDGSTVTVLEKTVAISLGLSGPKKSLCLQWTNKMIQTEEDSQIVSGQISWASDRAKKFSLKNEQTVSSLDLIIHSLDADALKLKWPHIADIPFESMTNVKPSLIIGEDNILLTIARSVRHAGWQDLVASKALLEWVVQGSTSLPKRVDRLCIHQSCETDQDEDLNAHSYWTRSGLKHQQKKSMPRIYLYPLSSAQGTLDPRRVNLKY